MKKFINFCVIHPVSVLMTICAIILCGFICAFTVKMDFLPQTGDRFLLVTTEFEGIPAAEMKKLVTTQIEDSSASLKGIKNVESVTRDGLSLITIELHWNTDIDIALSECREIIDNCFETLPAGCEKPIVKVYNPNESETFTLCIKSNDGDLKYCKYIAENDIKARLQRINGVSSVTVTGGEKEEVHVNVNKTKMESAGLSLQNISDSIAEANFEYPAGVISEGNKEFVFKTSGLFTNIQEIEKIPLANNQDSVIRISDLGTVEFGTKEKETFFMHNGEECLSIGITKKTDASPVTVSKLLKKEIENLNYLYGNYFSFELINDQSVQLISSIKNLLLSALIGIAITLIILFVFFKTPKTSLLAASMIPLSILFSIIALALCGRTINVLSLSGIAVGIGMVVDPATVVIENIHKNFSDKKELSQIITDSTSEVTLSSIGSSLTTIIVFIPFFFLKGLLGKLFMDVSIAVISSIAFACILSFSYIPAMYSLMFQRKKGGIAEGIKVQKLEDRYSKILPVFFKNRFLKYAVLLICIAAGSVLVLSLKKELLPKTYSKNIYADVFYEEGDSLEKIYEDSNKLYSEMNLFSEISNVCISGGIDPSDYEKLCNPSIKKEYMHISLVSSAPDKTKKKLETLLQMLSSNYSIRTGNDILASVISIEKNSYLVTGDDEEDVMNKAQNAAGTMGTIVPASFVTENVFKPDRTACSRFNIGAISTAVITHNTLEGIYSTYMYIEGRQIPVLVMFPKGQINTVEQLLETGIVLDQNVIPIKSLGNITKENNEKILYRNNRRDAKKVITAEPVALSQNVTSIEKTQLNELFSNAVILLVIILFLLYCVMGAQFESFKIPLFMLLAIPPAFSGAFLGLLVFGQTININSVIALVVLFGVSVNNAIILYESAKELKTVDRENIITACVRKLRVILLTTLTTIFALVPFAIDPLNKNSQASMSIAIICGLLFSFLIILFVIPPVLANNMRAKKE